MTMALKSAPKLYTYFFMIAQVVSDLLIPAYYKHTHTTDKTVIFFC